MHIGENKMKENNIFFLPFHAVALYCTGISRTKEHPEASAGATKQYNNLCKSLL